ncbi:MAG: SUMF1/EgtB/PvdO family nonheme iron enzyme [Gemmataceae bacterium]|nr:SUMF1/EgtB/PvdO family nonheme iron enzyme [Gemmata sp.]MDW8198401.1 SUMF1/EgtB/PvdO family nonheme iron enzyme [Gemmataceae bacterium]
MDLSSERWQAISPREREILAHQLVRELPTGFSFLRVQRFRLGECQQDVALYQKDDALFALIPGGCVTLGYDAQRPWQPRADEWASWQDTVKEYGFPPDIREYIAQVTLRVRHVSLAPFLIETTASAVGWEPIAQDDPEGQEIVREYIREYHRSQLIREYHRSQLILTLYRGGVTFRVITTPDGEISAQRAITLTHAALTAQWAAAGFRLPTSDEWEYACGGGATTLFRWGDHVPCNRYPTDGGGEHGQPNAFGLFIAADPYQCELVAERGVTRGGDGGVLICGGVGFFVSWLTLATAYFEQQSCHYDAQQPLDPHYTVGRRVLALR